MVNRSSSAREIRRTSLLSLLGGSAPPTGAARKQIENCCRTSPSVYSTTWSGFVEMPTVVSTSTSIPVSSFGATPWTSRGRPDETCRRR
ncbi:hypothetical protein AB0H83_49480 [Dactylosporangium sp. NPDC050688]|uniref:hypothetical protein n=1 Tax=Dactylosporangium sp. NPDC050688 TaxID=3157217 RepID=UPI0033CC4A97